MMLRAIIAIVLGVGIMLALVCLDCARPPAPDGAQPVAGVGP
jgi:hypothetical protein